MPKEAIVPRVLLLPLLLPTQWAALAWRRQMTASEWHRYALQRCGCWSQILLWDALQAARPCRLRSASMSEVPAKNAVTWSGCSEEIGRSAVTMATRKQRCKRARGGRLPRRRRLPAEARAQTRQGAGTASINDAVAALRNYPASARRKRGDANKCNLAAAAPRRGATTRSASTITRRRRDDAARRSGANNTRRL